GDFRCLESLVPGHHASSAINDQQQENKRSHGAQEHCQERKRIDLEALSALPHAAFPGRVVRIPPLGGAARAVRRWIAAVRLCMASSNRPVSARETRFWLSDSCNSRSSRPSSPRRADASTCCTSFSHTAARLAC